MFAVVSPAKKLDYIAPAPTDVHSEACFLDEAQILMDELKAKSRGEIKALMHLSDKLAELNYERYQDYALPFDLNNAKQAIYAFRGDTYIGLDADSLSADDVAYAQDHFGILSGLYGLLRPLDLMRAYRLEMGTKLHNPRGEDLYDFWGTLIADAINDITRAHKDRTVVSLASNEYIKAVKPKALEGDFITCHFKEMKDTGPKVIGLFAKRARGAMARFMIQNRLETPEGLKDFTNDGYSFQADLSDDHNLVFLR